jgi:cysteinyl-tRNA synthetase, unknown class
LTLPGRDSCQGSRAARGVQGGARRIAILLVAVALLGRCGAAPAPDPPTEPGPLPVPPPVAPGFPSQAPWLSFYGSAEQMGDLDRVARTFRIINIDADPDLANFSVAEIQQLRAAGRNRVISYLDIGSCEEFRSYFRQVPAGLVSCQHNPAAQLGPYDGYPDEVWMNPANLEYQRLILEHVAPRLAAQGVDGFFLDNLEIIEHGSATDNGPCDAACSQGGLDLVRRLRERFPALLIVMQNATSARTLTGWTGSVRFPSLLDGISHEEVYAPEHDAGAEAELAAWRALDLRPGGMPFWIGTEDYVGGCQNVAAARSAYDRSRARGFSPYASDASAGQQVVCYWPF